MEGSSADGAFVRLLLLMLGVDEGDRFYAFVLVKYLGRLGVEGLI